MSNSFWAMGGYAAYVWPAYAISLIALVALSIVSWRAMRRAERLVSAANVPTNPDL